MRLALRGFRRTRCLPRRARRHRARSRSRPARRSQRVVVFFRNARTASRSVVAFRKYIEIVPRSNHRLPKAFRRSGGNSSRWIDPATVPPRKPSRVAVASSWMLAGHGERYSRIGATGRRTRDRAIRFPNSWCLGANSSRSHGDRQTSRLGVMQHFSIDCSWDLYLGWGRSRACRKRCRDDISRRRRSAAIPRTWR